MKVLLANPRGFCAGVNMAVQCVEEVLELKGPPVYVFHEIVHNRHVVDGLRARGVVFVDTLEEVPAGSVVVYSAHGVSPEVRNRSHDRKLVEVDATCPLVTKVHIEVLRFARQGYTIIFVGHRDHDEAVGTVGEAPNNIVVVESAQDVWELVVPDTTRLAYVTQTTLSVSDAARVVAALRERFPGIKGPPKEDICYATTNRQAAVTQLSSEADLVLVIGSKNSSNSQRLVERAIERGKPAYLIDNDGELQPQWFDDVRCVLVTAGASAPEHLVDALLARLKVEYGGIVETRTLVEEDITFEQPRSLRQLVVLS
jgi:4-hydroxy-3-methylbut-2-en-1-yl diphosphate reductase